MKEHIQRELTNDMRLIACLWKEGFIKDYGRLRTIIGCRIEQAFAEQRGEKVVCDELEYYRKEYKK